MENNDNTNTNFNYLDNYAGVGTSNLTGQTPFLSISQKASEDLPQKLIGQWWHSGLRKCYGKEIHIIPLAIMDIWIEKGANGRTVAYHKPNSIELLKEGQGKSYRVKNIATGNKVDCTYAIVVNVVDANETDTKALFIPSIGMMKAIRSWKQDLAFNRLPSGKPAPIFSNIWTLKIAKISGDFEYYTLETPVKKGEFVSGDMFQKSIEPLMNIITSPERMLPTVSAETVIETEKEAEPF